MSDTATKFSRVAELARQARAVHLALDPQAWGTAVPTIDADLAALKRLVESGLGQAVHARNAGNRALGDQLEAQAAATLDAALPLWRARLAAAEAERDRVKARQPVVDPVQERQESLYGTLIGRPAPAQDLLDAAIVLTRTIDNLRDAAAYGRFGDTALLETLASMDTATAAFRAAIVRERLATRIRISAAAATAVASVLEAA